MFWCGTQRCTKNEDESVAGGKANLKSPWSCLHSEWVKRIFSNLSELSECNCIKTVTTVCTTFPLQLPHPYTFFLYLLKLFSGASVMPHHYASPSIVLCFVICVEVAECWKCPVSNRTHLWGSKKLQPLCTLQHDFTSRTRIFFSIFQAVRHSGK